MRYLSIFMLSCCFVKGFPQGSQTVTLVFVTPANDPYKNYEAVIDDVSYYSENKPNGNTGVRANDRNTIWLSNFPPGQHTIQVYNIKNGTMDERAANSPAYSSTFTVKEGYDTKIAVSGNGHVQFSERLSANDNNGAYDAKRDKNIYAPGHDNKSVGTNSSHDSINDSENNNAGNNRTDTDNPAPGSDSNTNDTYNNNDTNVRHSRKRIDTATVINTTGGDNTENTTGDNTKINRRNDDGSNGRLDNQANNENGKAPMDDEHFSRFYENIRNQWLPGQKMKTLTNEFLNNDDNFTTAQAKQLILLVTDELNRLKLAKSSYHCITDPENFADIDDVFRYQESRDQLNDFIGKQ